MNSFKSKSLQGFLLCLLLSINISNIKAATFTKSRQEVPYTSSMTIPESQHILWYLTPSQNWMTSSLPIGNGHLGAMIFGGIQQEEVQFNEKTLCTGTPCKNGDYLSCIRGAYQNFGSLYIHSLNLSKAENYQRQLNLQTATAQVSYESNGVRYKREYIASSPDDIIAIHYTADKPESISIVLNLVDGHKAPVTCCENTLSAEGKLETVSYRSIVKVITKGGRTQGNEEDGLTVKEADEVLILLKAGTDYDPESLTYLSNTKSFASDMMQHVDKKAKKSWKALYKAHVKDFQSFYNRVNLSLTDEPNDRPTSDLLMDYTAKVKAGQNGSKLLEQQIFNMGRYLLISSSRGVTHPANLQGIWNNTNTPPWFCDIHANVNVQMNYWPAEITNLSDLHTTFLDYIYNEVMIHPQWRANAFDAKKALTEKLYGKEAAEKVKREDAKGWVLYTGNSLFGGGGTFMINNVSANAWNCMHLWQHYCYTLDKEYLLNKAYPLMKSCCEFWIDRLIEDRGARKGSSKDIIKDFTPDGTLVAPLEFSPENGPASEDGVAHAQQLCWDLFNNTLTAMDVLGDNVSGDSIFKKTLKKTFDRLDPGTHIDDDGILKEWKYSERTAGQPFHRHNSHLMGLFPGSQISQEKCPQVFEAAVKSLLARGTKSTGWSIAWKINLWARALNGEKAYSSLQNFLNQAITSRHGGVFPNLLCTHPPFQIDGNFGTTSGIAEMLLQSHTGTIHLLPAIPEQWNKGSYKGLCAVGAFEIDLNWEKGLPTTAIIHSKKGHLCTITAKNINKAKLFTRSGKQLPIAWKEGKAMFKTKAGHSYKLIF